MIRKELEYRKDVAFINREKELVFLKGYLNERPEAILFIHGPKS
jgi:AAA+ ATPase superfamily predicted ATPase